MVGTLSRESSLASSETLEAFPSWEEQVVARLRWLLRTEAKLSILLPSFAIAKLERLVFQDSFRDHEIGCLDKIWTSIVSFVHFELLDVPRIDSMNSPEFMEITDRCIRCGKGFKEKDNHGQACVIMHECHPPEEANLSDFVSRAKLLYGDEWMSHISLDAQKLYAKYANTFQDVFVPWTYCQYCLKDWPEDEGRDSWAVEEPKRHVVSVNSIDGLVGCHGRALEDARLVIQSLRPPPEYFEVFDFSQDSGPGSSSQ